MNSKAKNTKTTASKVVSKTKDVAKKTGEFVGENPKTALYIGAGVLAIGVIYIAFKTVNDASDKVGEILDGDPNIEDEILLPYFPTPNATINDSAASIYASQLLDAMNVKLPFYGTDNGVVSSVFDKLKNGDDYLKVYQVFGKKDYNGYNSPPTGFWSSLDSYEKRDLNHWLKSELSNWFEPTLYNKVKSRVESAGFVF